MPTLEVVANDVDTSISDDDKTVELNNEEEDPPVSSCTPTKVKEDESNETKDVATTNPVTSSKNSRGTSELEIFSGKQVTPCDIDTVDTKDKNVSKQQQQEKVKQMTIGSFFFGVKKSPFKSNSPEAANKSKSSALKKSPCKASTSEGTKDEPIELGDSSPDASPKPVSPKKEESEAEEVEMKEGAAEEKPVEIDVSDSTDEVATTASKQQPTEAAKDNKNTADDTAAKTEEIEVVEPKKETKKPSSRKRRASAAKVSTLKPVNELSKERQEALQKYTGMKSKCTARMDELFQEVVSGLPEESFAMPEPTHRAVDEGVASDEFPDVVVANMILLIEGSALPISKLTEGVCKMLSECHAREWGTHVVANKIKLLSQRKSYMDQSKTTTIDLYEDEATTRIWRWEISIVDIFPSEVLSKVRKARTARKKIAAHWTATQKLIQALTTVETVIRDPEVWPKYDKETAKVSQCEEKVLKFEREAEKKRLAEQAKKRKQEEHEMKKREKELQKERKKQESEKKKQETEAKKQEAVKARDEAKRKREAEKVEQKKAEEEKKVKNLGKQKACLMSFFAGPAKKKSRMSVDRGGDFKPLVTPSASSDTKSDDPHKFDVENFRSMINAGYKLSSNRKAIASTDSSRKHRTAKIALNVYVTVQPTENAWDAQPFAEQRKVMVSNRYHFLSFHEDCRPPYYGTWSKTSNIVSGRNPFGKDTKYLDYDYDTEAEWEEGDDEIGEDIEDEEKCKDDDDDEGDARIYDYDDGFCVADDRYLDSEDGVDDETKALHKKKLQKGENETALGSTVCIVAPAMGGLPAAGIEKSEVVVEGYEVDDGIHQLSIHQGIDLCPTHVCLDAFPPPLVDENQVENNAPASTSGESNTQKDEYSVEDMRLLATFTHHCELNSKEKVIEGLRTAHPTVFTNRAKAMRKLDSIAMKKRFNHSTGVYWEVKRSVLEQLELKDVLAKKVEDEPPKKAETTPRSKTASPKTETTKSKTSSKKRASSSDATNPKSPKQKKAEKANKSPKTSSPKKASPKKEKEDTSMKASANLLSSFLIKKKPKASA